MQFLVAKTVKNLQFLVAEIVKNLHFLVAQIIYFFNLESLKVFCPDFGV